MTNRNNVPQVESSAQTISFLINQVGKRKLFQNFNLTDILAFLKQKDQLSNFLLLIPSQQLFQSAYQRQEKQQQQARENSFKFNILNMSISQLRRHCKNYHLISRNDISQNHYFLGNLLVEHVPNLFYIGTKSTHYNSSKKLQERYYISRQRQQQEQINEEQINQSQQQQLPIQPQLQGEQAVDNEEQQSDNQSQQFINDEVSQSNYQQSEFQQQLKDELESQEQEQISNKKIKSKKKSKKNLRKNKKIKKESNPKRNIKGAKQRKVQQPLITRFAKQKNTQSQWQQIFVEDYKIGNNQPDDQNINPQEVKSNQKDKKKSQNQKQQMNLITTARKKLTLDSDLQND